MPKNTTTQNTPRAQMIALFLVGLISITVPAHTTTAQSAKSPNFNIYAGSVNSTNTPTDTTSPSFTLSDADGTFHTQSPETSSSTIALTPSATLPTPPAPTLTNPDNFHYNKLHITLPTDTVPDDTLFAVAISNDNWTTWHYIATDGALSTQLTRDHFQSIDYWGSTDGAWIYNLAPDTSYKTRTAALTPSSTQTRFSPSSAVATTTVPFLRMTLSDNITDFTIMNTTDIAHATSTQLTVSTNANHGYQTYLRGTGDGTHGGLFNAAKNHLIPSTSTTLTQSAENYGAQATAPHATVNPQFTGTGDMIGAIPTTNTPLSTNTGNVMNDQTTISLKLSITPHTPAGHYTDTIYYTVTPNL